MRDLFLFFRRVAGFFGLIFGGRQAWDALRELKKLDAAKWASRIVSDSVLMNDIPSPSDNEALRMEFISKRLTEFGVSNVFSDEWGNVLALFPAHGTRRDFVLLVADVGDANYTPLGNSVHLSTALASGQGLGERSLGAAALLVFAEFAQETGFHLDKNLLILFTRSSSVDEREEAFRHFLSGWADRIACGILVRGTGLGVIESRYVGSYRLSVSVHTEEREMLTPGAAASAASILGTIAAELSRGPWSESPRSVVNIARMEAGAGFGHWPTQGDMDIEIVSEDEKTLESLKHAVTEAIERVAAGTEAKIDTFVRFKRSVGDPRRNAPLVEALRSALVATKVKADSGLVSEKVSLLNERSIPAVALGITRTTSSSKEEEIYLGPVASGFRQLLLVVEGSAAATRSQE